MVLASSYVVERIYLALEENKSKGQEVFEKFSRRYPKDLKLIEIYDKFRSDLPSPKQEDLVKVKLSLDQLKTNRKLLSDSSITNSYNRYLWYKSRRP